MKIKTYIDSFGIPRISVSGKKDLFSLFVNANTESKYLQNFIDSLTHKSTLSIDEIKENIMDWDPNIYSDIHRGVYIPVWGIDNLSIYYTEEGHLMIQAHSRSYSIETSFDEIIQYLNLIKKIFIRYEQPESFKTYLDMLSLVNDKYSDKMEALGFRCVAQMQHMVRFANSWLFIDILEDQDGPVLFFTNNILDQKYEFNMALELLDWDAANLHALLCQKYMSKMSREEARTGVMEITFKYLESHFSEILKNMDESFFRKLEEDRILRSKMLMKVLALPKDNRIHQMFLNNNPLWWEYMREEIAQGEELEKQESKKPWWKF